MPDPVTTKNYVVGFEAKIFRGAAGTTASTEMLNIKDVTPNKEATQIDVTTRQTHGWNDYIPGLKDGSLEIQVQYDPTDADYIALHNAFHNNTPIALFVTDGLGNGLDADWHVFGESEPQPLNEAIVTTFTCKPTSRAGRYPTEVRAGSNSN